MSIVGKHFPLSNRTIAMSFVTAVGSFGYFLSPIFTNYSLSQYGWNYTLYLFAIFFSNWILYCFLCEVTVKFRNFRAKSDQTAKEALSEAFSNKSYNLLVSGFLFVVFI